MNNSDYSEIGYSIYKEIWDKNINNTITPRKQHASTEKKMCSKDRVYQSLELMAASYIECQNLSVEKTCDLFYFNKIIAVFAYTYNGVIHAGDLLAQNLVVIGASVLLYILKFAIFVEVGETNPMKYLKEKFNLFQSLEEVSYDSATLMIDL